MDNIIVDCFLTHSVVVYCFAVIVHSVRDFESSKHDERRSFRPTVILPNFTVIFLKPYYSLNLAYLSELFHIFSTKENWLPTWIWNVERRIDLCLRIWRDSCVFRHYSISTYILLCSSNMLITITVSNVDSGSVSRRLYASPLYSIVGVTLVPTLQHDSSLQGHPFSCSCRASVLFSAHTWMEISWWLYFRLLRYPINFKGRK